MIIGIGTDIVEIDRIEKAVISTPRFYEKIFTMSEKDYYISKNKNIQHLAGAFAAKEAVTKALGTGFRKIGANEIGVEHDKLGKPIIKLSGEAEKISNELRISNIHLTISHCKTYAVAYVIVEGEN